MVVIDNYDSFVYNLVQYLGELGAEPLVYRNDELTVAELQALAPDAVVVSPGPRRPEDAGISNRAIAELVDLHYNQVGLWRQRYGEYGIGGLDDVERPGRPCVYDHDDVLLLVKLVTEDPPASTANPMFEEIEQPGVGRYLAPASPIDPQPLGRVPVKRAPLLGEHTEEILADLLGLSPHEIGDLHDRGVVAGPALDATPS